jgi:hypothetical protein
MLLSFNPESLSGGIGVVINDDSGRFVAACSHPVHYAIDANILQVQAINRGIALPSKVGCSCIIIQSMSRDDPPSYLLFD